MLATLRDFARMLGLSTEEQASDAIRSERAFTLSRRGLFVGAAALATGKAFGFAAPEPKVGWVSYPALYLTDIRMTESPYEADRVEVLGKGLLGFAPGGGRLKAKASFTVPVSKAYELMCLLESGEPLILEGEYRA